MNSSSNLPPTGLLLRLRVIGQEQKGAGPFLNDSVFSHLPGGQKWEIEGDCLGGFFIPNGKNRQAKTEVMSRRRLQEEPVSFSGVSPLPKGGLLPRGF